MNARPRALLLLSGAALLAAVALHPGASSANPGDPASLADAGASPPPPDTGPFPAEKTPLPAAAEWKDVPAVSLIDGLDRVPVSRFLPSAMPGCRSYRLREWVKVHCSSLPTSRIALLGGQRDDVFLFVTPETGGNSSFSFGGEILFAVRRGDRRVFEWCTFGDSYEGPGEPLVAFQISEDWVGEEERPTLVASGSLGGS
jgi:hypothetical protein